MKDKHAQKDKDCQPKCEKKCNKEKKCCEEIPEITAEKNLLNLSYLIEGSGISGPDVSATYEIVIFNRSCHDICNLSIDDTFCGLLPNDFTPDGEFGGELRPYFTGVDASTLYPTVVPNTFDQIVATKGQILAAGSYVPAFSIVSILIRITGRGFLMPVTPNGGVQITGSQTPNVSMCLQNTAIIKGDIKKRKSCGCHVCVPIFPLYVKSGEKETQKISNLLFQNLP